MCSIARAAPAQLGVGADVQIIEEYDPSLPEAWADADQLLQVLLNLLKNAAEAAGAGGVIRLRTSYEHGVSPAHRRWAGATFAASDRSD